MDVEALRVIVNDPTLTDAQLAVLLLKAQNEAINHYFWKADDIPTEEQKEKFLSKYEFEIYDIVRAMNSDDARDGQISHSELGVSRSWGETGRESVLKALAVLPKKAYVL